MDDAFADGMERIESLYANSRGTVAVTNEPYGLP